MHHAGLDSVTECVKAGSQEALYLCEVCLSRMKRTDVRNHIMGSLHRYSYIVSGRSLGGGQGGFQKGSLAIWYQRVI